MMTRFCNAPAYVSHVAAAVFDTLDRMECCSIHLWCDAAVQQPQTLTLSGGGCAQYLTLVFIGCISVSSLRAFLRNMHQARIVAGTEIASSAA